MYKTKIVMIDSGVSAVNKRIQADKIQGIGIDFSFGNYFVTEEVRDWADHGTGIYGILKAHNKNADIFVIRICEGRDELDHLEELFFILQYLYENISCDLVNISMAVCYHNNFEMMKKIEELCEKIRDRGTIIVAAFDNFGGLSYPALFQSVIGVSKGEHCFTCTDVEYVQNRMVNICAKGDPQSVISRDGRIITREGNSLACAHVTGIISNFYQKSMSFTDVLEQLHKISCYVHKDFCEGEPQSKIVIKNMRGALVTFGKEMHSLVRFQKLLQFQIAKIYDVKQTGKIGKSTSKELHINQESDYIIENIELAEFDSFDFVVIGHISNLMQFQAIKGIIEIFLKECKKFGKFIYSYDELDKYFAWITRDDYFSPRVLPEHVNNAPLGKLFYISKPILGVFGTSSVQGKFSLQLYLRQFMEEQGYKVGQIGTEPTALLFGMEYCFPFGFNSNVKIARYDIITYLNSCLYDISKKDTDLIIVGCQSRTIQENNCNLDNYTIQQTEFLLATQPDVVVLCINIWDTTEYVVRTIQYIESIISCQVVALAMSPIHRILKDDNTYVYESVDKEKISEIMKVMSNVAGKPVYSIADLEEIHKLSSLVISSLS